MLTVFIYLLPIDAFFRKIPGQDLCSFTTVILLLPVGGMGCLCNLEVTLFQLHGLEVFCRLPVHCVGVLSCAKESKSYFFVLLAWPVLCPSTPVSFSEQL